MVVLRNYEEDQQQQISELTSLVKQLGSHLGVLFTHATSKRSKGKESAKNNATAHHEPKGSADSEPAQTRKKKGKLEEDVDIEDFVSRAYYRDRIEEGFGGASKPFYYPIDNPVTRTLAASKYTGKLAKYALSVSNAFLPRLHTQL
jgi:hypothetical protein